MLNMLLHIIISQFEDWPDDKSATETTVYRRFPIILDILFRSTNILLKDGECVAKKN
ncbi:hypothetical protein BDC45DRAFT_567145 [Circinella umbellata]|nr:hypothetical protein BDC45DRAFT_567145 [Circinella umbellata]